MMGVSRIVLFSLIGGLIISFLSACQNDGEELQLVDEPETRSFPNVDPALWSYYADFESEASRRGLDIDLVEMRISGDFEDIEGEHIAGQCAYGRFTPGAVTIDTEFWRAASGRFREMVVFHELGHCALFRGHSEETLNNGACASIMRSGNGSCRDNYNNLTRSSYLDELFENTNLQ